MAWTRSDWTWTSWLLKYTGLTTNTRPAFCEIALLGMLGSQPTIPVAFWDEPAPPEWHWDVVFVCNTLGPKIDFWEPEWGKVGIHTGSGEVCCRGINWAWRGTVGRQHVLDGFRQNWDGRQPLQLSFWKMCDGLSSLVWWKTSSWASITAPAGLSFMVSYVWTCASSNLQLRRLRMPTQRTCFCSFGKHPGCFLFYSLGLTRFAKGYTRQRCTHPNRFVTLFHAFYKWFFTTGGEVCCFAFSGRSKRRTDLLPGARRIPKLNAKPSFSGCWQVLGGQIRILSPFQALHPSNLTPHLLAGSPEIPQCWWFPSAQWNVSDLPNFKSGIATLPCLCHFPFYFSGSCRIYTVLCTFFPAAGSGASNGMRPAHVLSQIKQCNAALKPPWVA